MRTSIRCRSCSSLRGRHVRAPRCESRCWRLRRDTVVPIKFAGHAAHGVRVRVDDPELLLRVCGNQPAVAAVQRACMRVHVACSRPRTRQAANVLVC